LRGKVGDRQLLEESIGRRASAALSVELAGKTWGGLRQDLGVAGTGTSAAGFRFAVGGRWASPSEWIQEEPTVDSNASHQADQVVALDAMFTDRSGGACGRIKLDFLLLRTPERFGYVVDNPNIIEVLRFISACLR
jgi:hypothetical protein